MSVSSSSTLFFMVKLMESWAKSPFLNNANVLICGECVPHSYPDLFSSFSKGKVVLTVCPEVETPIYGKLASMMTSTTPASIEVLTIDCSPDCYTLHAAVNEAFYISKKDIQRTHYVILNGIINQISKEAIRLSRYLTLTEKAITDNPNLLELLKKYSLEQQCNK